MLCLFKYPRGFGKLHFNASKEWQEVPDYIADTGFFRALVKKGDVTVQSKPIVTVTAEPVTVEFKREKKPKKVKDEAQSTH